jgi:hypothetical protein
MTRSPRHAASPYRSFDHDSRRQRRPLYGVQGSAPMPDRLVDDNSPNEEMPETDDRSFDPLISQLFEAAAACRYTGCKEAHPYPDRLVDDNSPNEEMPETDDRSCDPLISPVASACRFAVSVLRSRFEAAAACRYTGCKEARRCPDRLVDDNSPNEEMPETDDRSCDPLISHLLNLSLEAIKS